MKVHEKKERQEKKEIAMHSKRIYKWRETIQEEFPSTTWVSLKYDLHRPLHYSKILAQQTQQKSNNRVVFRLQPSLRSASKVSPTWVTRRD